MQKSADAYRTISEVADELKLPQHVLRFWETRFPQLKPMKRGGNRRFYHPEDVELLRAIRTLLYGDGYTIRGVQRLLKEQGPRGVTELVKAGQRRPERRDVPVAPAHAVDRDAGSPNERREPREEHAAISPSVDSFAPAEPRAPVPLSSDPPRQLSAAPPRPETERDAAADPFFESPTAQGGKAAGDLPERLEALLVEIEACARMLLSAREPRA